METVTRKPMMNARISRRFALHKIVYRSYMPTILVLFG